MVTPTSRFLLCGLLVVLAFVSTKADEAKIVGGHPVPIEKVPHQASLRYFRSHICGGSVISNRFIITAAHCVYPSINPYYAIRVGTAMINDAADNTYYSIEDAIIHPNYSYSSSDYDIAILKVGDNITFSHKVRPVGLVEQDLVIEDGEEVNVTGWGNTKEGGAPPDVLLSVTVPVVAEEKCRLAYENIVGITSRMLCAGAEQGGLDSCQGDSGGGLTYEGQLAGIVSFGLGCARPSYPGVYTRVAAVRDWIDKVIAENS